MKLENGLRVFALHGGITLLAAFAPIGTAAESTATAPTQTQAAIVDPAATPALTRAEALKLVAEAKRYVAHPSTSSSTTGKPSEPVVTTPDFQMDNPPPALRAENKPEAPAATGYVWVPGHYMPVKGEWRWVRGEWAVPAQPISVWIPAKYDEKEKKWSPGYWQPDAVTTGEPQAPKSSVPPPKY